MNSELFSLRLKIQECSLCSFRDQAIIPLAPSEVKLPISAMFIGENPSWANGQTEPFSSSTISGDALEKNYLEPLGLTRSQVWITDLFKCRYPLYPIDIYHSKAHYEQLIQANAEICARKWLVSEILLAQPKIVVSLSDEPVYQRLRKAFSLSTPARFSEAVGKSYNVTFGQWETLLFPMIHPDVSRPIGDGDRRKENVRKKWAPYHSDIHIPALKSLLNRGIIGKH